jgi:hypothetical protein
MRILPVLATMILAVGGCAALARDNAANTEKTLSAAGFTIRPITTLDERTMVAGLPPNRISRQINGSHVSYLYPDPINCRCLYIGGQAAYGRYQQFAIQEHIANEQVEAAQLNNDFAWDWGPWGGYGPAYY